MERKIVKLGEIETLMVADPYLDWNCSSRRSLIVFTKETWFCSL